MKTVSSYHQPVALLYLGLCAIILAFSLLQGQSPPTFPHEGVSIFGGDYLNLWAASTLIREGKADLLWDIHTYNHFLQTRIHPNIEVHGWSYPPSLLLFIHAFAYMPYKFGYAWWMLMSFFPLLMAMRGYHFGLPAMLITLLSPVSLFNIVGGQNGFLTAGLLALCLQNRDHSPGKSALYLAGLSVKPHLAILLTGFLLYEKRRAVLWQTSILVATMIGMSVLVWGFEPWYLYATHISQQQWQVITQWHGAVEYLMPSFMMALRLLNFSSAAMIAGQITYSILILGLTVLALRTWRNNELITHAILMIGTIAILPYFFVYDMMPYQLAVLLLLAHCLTQNFTVPVTKKTAMRETKSALALKDSVAATLGESKTHMPPLRDPKDATLKMGVLCMMPYFAFSLARLTNWQITPLILMLLLGLTTRSAWLEKFTARTPASQKRSL